ncbi:MAG: hypothetical protein WAO76_12580 [Georgfuchsia sp.]
MGNDLRGQLSQVGPPAEGVIGDLPVAKSRKRLIMVVILAGLIVIGGYAAVAGKDKKPDPVALGMKPSAEQPVSGLPPAPPVPSLVGNQPQVVALPVQAAPSFAQKVALSASEPLSPTSTPVKDKPAPLSSASAKVLPRAKQLEKMTAIPKPAAIAARPIARVKTPAANIDQIGIIEE